MPTFELDQAARITWRMTEDGTGEIFQFGLSTGKRDPQVIPDLLANMELAWTDNLAARIASCTLRQIVYAEWGSSGFVGFHQVQEVQVSHVSSGGSPLPPQCALVVSLLNSVDNDISLKRRRGRMYLGLIPAAHIDSAGKYSSTQHNALVPGMADLFQDLIDIVPTATAPGGPCIASAAEGALITADKFGVGYGIDTQRRRRQKVNEAITYTDVPDEPQP